MNRLTVAIAGIVVAGAAIVVLTVDRPDPSAVAAEHWQTIDRYCVDCHNGTELSGGVAFDSLGPDRMVADAEIWEKAIRKLNGGFMPPPGEPRPSADQLEELIGWLESTQDEAARDNPQPGAPALHRLNRSEYANAVRDLLDLPFDATSFLPGDDSSAGFDNIASALSVSPALMQAYVAAAARISRLAIGDPTISPGETTYSVPRGVSQDSHVEGLPFGTRGGLLVEHVFPLAAEYEIRVRGGGSGFGLRNVGGDEPTVITLNGEELALLGPRDGGRLTAHIEAGPQLIGAAVLASSQPRGVNDLNSVWAAISGVSSISIMGPLNPSGPGDTRSRRRIFVCQPESSVTEPECAREILTTLATRAFRRPVDRSDESIATLMSFFEDGRRLRGFETGIQYALARILVDPEFIFRFEHEPEDIPDGSVYALGDFELASRLSFFLWSSIPDDELFALADDGELRDRNVIEAQVRRMLADPKADALVENFASQWLGLRQLDSVLPETNEFDGNLRHAFRRETELLFEHVLREDLSILELLDADYTFVDERLARHYGIPNIRGNRFRRVELADDSRRGLLGHGSVLTVTSAPNRTSPVSRGAWILENILGTPPPAPPAGVETNLDQTAVLGPEPTSLRQRLERHRTDPSCASCHSLIDPLGFALENFDLIGEWREVDGNQPVDASARLWDGTEIAGPAGLRQALLDRQELFATHTTEKLLTYALGRALEASDMPTVREIVRAAAVDDYRISALIIGIVESAPFRMKVKQPIESPAPGA
jgi:mono/diheme cytochrome c family protein